METPQLLFLLLVSSMLVLATVSGTGVLPALTTDGVQGWEGSSEVEGIHPEHPGAKISQAKAWWKKWLTERRKKKQPPFWEKPLLHGEITPLSAPVDGNSTESNGESLVLCVSNCGP